MTKAFIPPSPVGSSPELADLLFMVFAYVADIDQKITPQEVHRFQALLKDKSWSVSKDLHGAADDLRQTYSSVWARYESRGLQVNTQAIAAALAHADRSLGAERGRDLRQALKAFLVQLERGTGAGLFGSAERRARAKARAEIREMLDADPQQLPAETSVAALSAPTSSLIGSEGVWSGGKTKVRCVGVIAETHDTKTYTFVSEPRVLFHFKPGQFVTIEVPIDGRVLRRSYTISSSPSRPYTLSITVKRVPKGWMSNWLYDNMAEGLRIDITGPSGHFNYLDHPSMSPLLLSGGSGVTPVMSMLRWIADTGSAADVVFLNNVRTPQDVIFHQELLHLSSRMGQRLKLGIVPGEVPAGQIWNGLTGRFSAELLKSFAPDFMARDVFVCGPAGYMETVRETLQSLGYPMERYHEESFGGAPATPRTKPALDTIASAKVAALAAPTLDAAIRPVEAGVVAALVPAAVAPPQAKAEVMTVTLGESGASFPMSAGETILEAAEANGVVLEYSCRSGACGACKVRKTKGTVDMPDQAILSDDDIADGYVLTCIATARCDLVLDT